MNDSMLYLICYDTPDNRRRRQIVATLEEFAERVQWSVFEGWLTQRQRVLLERRLQRLLEPEFDNLRLYRLCSYCQAEVQLLGLGEHSHPVKYWIC